MPFYIFNWHSIMPNLEAGFFANFSALDIGMIVVGVVPGVIIGVLFAYCFWVRPSDRKHAETIGTLSRHGSRHNSEKSVSYFNYFGMTIIPIISVPNTYLP